MFRSTRPTKPRRPALALERLDERTVPAVVALNDPSVLTEDVVVNRDGGVTDTSQSAVDRSGWAFMTQSYATFLGGDAGPGIPDDGFVAANSLHPQIRLPVDNADFGNNARVIRADTESFSFTPPADKYRFVHVVGVSTEHDTTLRLTLTYATGDPVTTGGANLPDWFDNFTETTNRYYLLHGMDRARATGDGVFENVNSPGVFGLRFAADPTRVLTGVTVEKLSGSPSNPSFFVFFGAFGEVVDSAPVVTADNPAVSADEGQTATNTGAVADPDLDAVTLTASVGTVVPAADGTWSWSWATTDGPTESQTVTVTASDGRGQSATTSFELAVRNVAPDFDAGPDATLGPAAAGHFSRTVTFTDPGADVWTALVDYGDGSGVQQLTVSGHSFTPDHVYPHTAADPVTATYPVTVQVSDGTDTHTDTFAVTVVLNTAPAATPDAAATDEDHAVTFGVLANDADAEGNVVPGLTVALTQPAAGVLTNNGDGTFTYDPAGAFGGLGAGASATVTFTYRVTDAFGLSDVGTVTVTVAGVNDGPAAAADSFHAAEDGTLTAAGGGLLANDTDPDAGDVLTVTAVNGSAAAVGTTVETAHGTVRVNADGSFTYTPDVAGAAADSFTYTVSDGHGDTATATVTLVIDHFAGVSLTDGVLRVGGGACSDVVLFLDGHLWVNGTSYALAGVAEVRVWGRGGDDLIELDGLTAPAFVSGGSGDDLIVGGSRDDVILGGGGNDVLLGVAGDDVILGGAGHDRIVGGSGNDVLVAGDYWGPTSLGALRALGAAWAGSHDSTGYDSGADDPSLDTATDKLTGSAGADWFIVSVGDVITDLPGVQQHDGDLITYRS